jgi:uncharacterized membrane protein
VESIGDGGDRAALLQLVEQAQASETGIASEAWARHDRPMPAVGALLCLASAVAFGAMAIFGKLAYDEGATVGTLLSVRFLLAAALFWALVACTGAARHLRGLSRRDVCTALALGGFGYSAQAGAYFAALVLAAVPVLAARGRRPRAVSARAVPRATRSVVAWRLR